MRLAAADIAIIDHAANLCGCSRTEFVCASAVRAAEKVLMESALVCMSADGFAAFMAMTAAPAQPVPEIVELFGRKTPWH